MHGASTMLKTGRVMTTDQLYTSVVRSQTRLPFGDSVAFHRAFSISPTARVWSLLFRCRGGLSHEGRTIGNAIRVFGDRRAVVDARAVFARGGPGSQPRRGDSGAADGGTAEAGERAVGDCP